MDLSPLPGISHFSSLLRTVPMENSDSVQVEESPSVYESSESLESSSSDPWLKSPLALLTVSTVDLRSLDEEGSDSDAQSLTGS